MRLLDFLAAEATVAELQAVEKEDVIEELVGRLVSAGKLNKRHAKVVTKAILEREALGSTGVGGGIAVPHAKHSSVKQIIGCLGRSKKGVDFAAIDGEPVYLVFLLISPSDQPGPHLKALEHISVVLRDENFSRFLTRAKDNEELVSLLAEADEKFYRD
ncbi:MAG: PTS fructose transporter subunit IIA [Planctomycetes bacterium DG_58]|nr:MAG: PTS fructose transporter subunit IIA [Planctomycetes bacterium DG_58]KPL02114.1 MAG: PTS fructose transporter subunit IIA [Planctomycetes bacterium SM23_65]